MKILFMLIVFNCLAINIYAQSGGEQDIKDLLQKESATWRSGDVKGHAECWAIRPYSRILVSRGDSMVLDIPPAVMIDPPPGIVGKGGSAVNSNYKMHIAGDNAWVSHDEVSTAADGKKTYSYEFRMLEKINGQWKLVAESIHIRPK